jgi:hypothetical protein
MARASKLLAHTRIASAGTDVVTRVAGLVTNCQRINLYNTHSAQVSVTVYLFRSGETTSDDGVVLDTVFIPSGKSLHSYKSEGAVLESDGDKIHMVASVDDVVDCNVFGTQE